MDPDDPLCYGAGLFFGVRREQPQEETPSLRMLAQTENGWNTAYMKPAVAHVQPQGITVLYGDSTATVMKAAYRNDSGSDWRCGNDYGSMQVQVDDVWYVIPDDSQSEGGEDGMDASPSIGYLLKPGEKLDASFGISSQLPNGYYRRIWNKVAVEFHINR